MKLGSPQRVSVYAKKRGGAWLSFQRTAAMPHPSQGGKSSPTLTEST